MLREARGVVGKVSVRLVEPSWETASSCLDVAIASYPLFLPPYLFLSGYSPHAAAGGRGGGGRRYISAENPPLANISLGK